MKAERRLLVAGLCAWSDVPPPTDAFASVLGFASAADLLVSGARLAAAISQGEPLLSSDWTRALLATECAFASDVAGLGRRWAGVTGFTDEQTVALLRDVQARLERAGVINHGAVPAGAARSLTPGVRRSARVLLFDGLGRLVLIRRTKPGREPALITPGGRREEGETIAETARRWARTQIGADVELGLVAHVGYAERPTPKVTHTFVARLVALEPTLTSTKAKKSDEVVHLRLSDPALASLRPAGLAELITQHGRLVARQAPPRHRIAR